MVSSVTSAPYYSYLNQLEGITDTIGAPAATTSAVTTPAPTNTATTTPTATASSQGTTASSLVSSLLGNGTTGLSSEVLSLLQENSSSSFDPITSLLGGTSTDDPLTSELANLYASSAAASLTQAQDNSTQQTAGTTGTASASTAATTSATTSPVQNLVNASVQASLAYNQTILQNAQNVINNNSYQADGVTPLLT